MSNLSGAILRGEVLLDQYGFKVLAGFSRDRSPRHFKWSCPNWAPSFRRRKSIHGLVS